MPKKADKPVVNRLQVLDDLYEMYGDKNPVEQPPAKPIIENQPFYKRAISFVQIEKLTPFNGHPFRPYEGERLDDMVESIRANGVLMPIIARKVGEVLEILAGHNRVNAARLAGLKEIPTLVYESISDDDAMVYVIETNLIQRSFSDMAHSEKAAVIALHHTKMFSQGKRNDIIEQLKMLEKPHDSEENSTFRQVGEKLRSDGIIADMYSLSKKTVSRYLRIQHLIPALKTRLDDGVIAFVPAVQISFIKESEQKIIADCMDKNGISVDMKKADTLRQFSEKGKLDRDSVNRILTGTMVHKPNRTPTVRVSKTVYEKYFKPNQPAKEVQEIVEKALALYFKKE
jgi:ParB family chromosome partitioning protein